MRTAIDFALPLARILVALPGRLVPEPLRQRALTGLLNEAFRASLGRGDLDFLEGAAVRIRITDLSIDWLLTVHDNRFRPLASSQPENVCISGDSLAFALLASRRADPDTLFFQRRIRVEGDTELGLGVKNSMDAMDWDDLPAPLRHILRSLGQVFDLVRPSGRTGTVT